MSLSNRARRKGTYQSPINVAMPEKSANDHGSGDATCNVDNNTHSNLPTKSKTFYRSSNTTDSSACVLRELKNSVQCHTTPQSWSCRSKTPFQPFRFLELPPEIRLMVYKLVVGVNLRIPTRCDHERMRKTIGTLPACGDPTIDSWNYCTCYDIDYLPLGGPRQIKIVSHNLQTSKQQINTERLIFDEAAFLEKLVNETKARAKGMQVLGLLRTCRQIYDEALSVLYHNNTFVFVCLAAYATYFGFGVPAEGHIPRSTEPHRLRAIQAMTKVEVYGSVGRSPFLDFLSTSRLIRAGLGCHTNLMSFKLNLEPYGSIDQRRKWMIDDSLFSKPPSLNKLVIGIWGRENGDEMPTPGEDQEAVAKELLDRIVKREDFTDMTELFLSDNGTAASTKALAIAEEAS